MIYAKSGKARGIYCLLAILFSLALAQISVGEESSTLHRFKPGDVLSSDIINEILDKIDNVTYGFKDSSELVGTWECKTASSNSLCVASAAYTAHESGLYSYLIQNVAFSDNLNGTYSFSTSKAHMFSCNGDGWDLPITDAYTVVEGTLILGDPTPRGTHLVNVRKISDNKMILDAVNSIPRSHMVICEKKSIPPDIPTNLYFDASNSIVRLFWTDNSDNESGFIVMRKDLLDDTYKEIGNTNTDTSTYTDTVPAAGDYWYRVKSINKYGDSLGSNVVKVTITR